jgi:hypothetical protein
MPSTIKKIRTAFKSIDREIVRYPASVRKNKSSERSTFKRHLSLFKAMSRSVITLLIFCLIVQQNTSAAFSLLFPSARSFRQSHRRHAEQSLSRCKMLASSSSSSSSSSSMAAMSRPTTTESTEKQPIHIGMAMSTALVVVTTTFGVFFGGPLVAFADEYGVEKEAPTLLTGETVEVRAAFVKKSRRSTGNQ